MLSVEDLSNKDCQKLDVSRSDICGSDKWGNTEGFSTLDHDLSTLKKIVLTQTRDVCLGGI